jgi:lysine 2,3-aminomutase
MPNYLLSMSDHKVILRNFEGYISTYEEPIEYQPHDPKTCAYCLSKRLETGQTGITGLLDGERLNIQPEGFDLTHRRGGGKHRLNSDEHKWQPHGIGTDTMPPVVFGEPMTVVNGEVI